ncbi:Pentatricopeptide repeat-containing protein At1g31430 [Linum perenne]
MLIRRSFPPHWLVLRHSFSNPSNFCTALYPASLNKRSCIRLLKECKSMAQLKEVHCQMYRNWLHQDADALSKLMVFCTDRANGNLNYAERVFGVTEKPCLFIYNLMIKVYAKKGSFRMCLLLFSRLKGDGLWPDNFTYPFVLKAIGYLGRTLEAKRVHGFVVVTGLQCDTYVVNSLMDMYAHLGRIDVAQKLFDQMRERDVVSWNVLISGYVRFRRFEDAIKTFCCMRKESGLRPDEATIVSTLSACTAVKSLELGKQIHCFVTDEVECTSIIGNALLDMYCKCGCLAVARELFDTMPAKNVICWTSMVSGYINCGKLDEARKLFEMSPARDIVLWTAMINGYVQFNQFDEAVELFRDMQARRIKPDKFLLVALLTGCAQTGALEQGKWIHEYIDENGISVDTIVGTALVDMYAKCGCIDRALSIFYALREKDTASWTSVICALALNGKTYEALNLFSEMKQVGVRPDDVTYIGVLSACSHGGLVEEGREFFNSMTKLHQIQPKLEHYGCFIDLLGRAGLLDEAEELIQKVPCEDPVAIIPLYGSLLSACRIYRNTEIGERIAKKLGTMASDDASVHTLLANIYASASRWQEVKDVRSKMKDLGVKKTPGCSLIEVDGVVHEFTVGDPSHPAVKEIYSTLDGLTRPLLVSENNLDSGYLIFPKGALFDGDPQSVFAGTRELLAEIGELKQCSVHIDKTGRPSGAGKMV